MHQILESSAYARAGLLGNPSDGYAGQTIAFTFARYRAVIRLSESQHLVISPSESDRLEFSSPSALSEKIDETGFYGGVRLLKSAIKRLHDYCRDNAIKFDRNFQISYRSSIPRQVGLAGSSAIIVATLRGLSQWHEFELSPAILAGLALDTENAIGITAGPQDRVIQSFEGTMYMDFSTMGDRGHLQDGRYDRMKIPKDHHLYIAFSTAAAEPTEVLHGDLKTKMANRDPATRDAIRQIATLAETGKAVIESGDSVTLAKLINQNFDLRRSVCDLNPVHIQMVETARRVGASAKYCGSGGAIVGTFDDETMYQKLKNELGQIQCTVFRPNVVEPD